MKSIHTLLTAPHGGRDVPGFVTTGKLRVGILQPLEKFGAMTSSDWNWRGE